MKKSQLLVLALCLTCVPTHITAADISDIAAVVDDVSEHAAAAHAPMVYAPTFQIFKDVDTELATLYPETLKDFDKVGDGVNAAISVIRKVSADWGSASREEMTILRDYYFNNFFEFMDRLKGKVADQALWTNIHQEAKSAIAGDLGKLDWRLIEVMHLRALLLAAGGGSEAAKDLLSIIPGTQIFFGALRDTPAALLKPDKPMVPAWQHSSVACVENSLNSKTRGFDVRKPYILMHPLDYQDMSRLIREVAKQYGLHKNVYIPMVDAGKTGITTLVKMWLNHVFPLPLLVDGEYKAHGLSLGSAVGAMHDKAHGTVDNRRRAVKQAIANLANKAATAGKNPRGEALQLAAHHMVTRYNALNQTLLAYVEAKERTAIDALTAAKALAPGLDARRAAEKAARLAHESAPDAGILAAALEVARVLAANERNNAARLEAEVVARTEYNKGVAALFQVLHEAYATKIDVLESPTLVEAITQLCANATSDEERVPFNELETFFNPGSDLSDAGIVARIKLRTLASAEIYPVAVGRAPAPTTIDEYDAAGKLDFSTLAISRGTVYTEVAFDEIPTGKRVKVQIPTAYYLVNTAKDENAVLRLIGQKVREVTLDMDALRALPGDDASRIAALEEVNTWLTSVEARTNAMVSGLTDDIFTHTPADAITAYDRLVTVQNAEWQALIAPVAVASV